MSKTHNVIYVPVGETQEMELTLSYVNKFLVRPTKKGQAPGEDDLVRFIMLCKSAQLNPWVGDAYLVGYDGADGPNWSLITAVKSLHKRAELHEAYDGIEAGVIVADDEGKMERREGSLCVEGDALVGGWARVHRKDRAHPFYAEVSLGVYNTGRSRWKLDPAGMIAKVAKAAALREAFPNQLAGLYTSEEQGSMEQGGTRPDLKAVRKLA